MKASGHPSHSIDCLWSQMKQYWLPPIPFKTVLMASNWVYRSNWDLFLLNMKHLHCWAKYWDPYSALMAIEQGGFFTVPHKMWHGTSFLWLQWRTSNIHTCYGAFSIDTVTSTLCYVKASVKPPVHKNWLTAAVNSKGYCTINSNGHSNFFFNFPSDIHRMFALFKTFKFQFISS